jgi:hypothetical protein
LSGIASTGCVHGNLYTCKRPATESHKFCKGRSVTRPDWRDWVEWARSAGQDTRFAATSV